MKLSVTRVVQVLKTGSTALGKDVVHYASVHVRQPEIASLESVGQLLVIDAE